MKGKVVLVTGASGGIGSALTRAFAERGCQVALHYFRSMDKATALRDELIESGIDAEFFQADISDIGQAKRLCGEVIKRFGRLDILINNAGIAQFKLFPEISDTDLAQMMGVNFNGAFFATQEAVKDMLKRKSGAIINISSVFGNCGASCEAHYSVSKAALDALTKSLAKELGPSGISVNSIACGLIDTEMNDNLSEADKKKFCDELPISRAGKPREVAELAVFLAKCGYITGQVICLDGGYSI